MTTVNIHEARTNLSQLLCRVAGGEEVVICRAGRPIARLVPFEPPTAPRVPGTAKGLVEVPDDFDDLRPEERLRKFEGRESSSTLTPCSNGSWTHPVSLAARGSSSVPRIRNSLPCRPGVPA